MSRRIINPHEKLLYEKAEKVAKELQANSKSEAFKAVHIQPYEVYAGTMDRLAPGGEYPFSGKAAYGANSMVRPHSGTEEARKHWNQLVQVSGQAESQGESFFYSKTPFNPGRPNQAIGFKSKADMEAEKLRKYTTDDDIVEFKNFEEGAAFFQKEIGDLYHGTGNPGGYVGDTPHFLGKVSTANQGALYVSPTSQFSEQYINAQQDWNLGQGGHLYKGEANFAQHNIFNPWNPDDVARLREHLTTKDYSEDELALMHRLYSGQGLPDDHIPFSDLSKSELKPRIDAILDRTMENVAAGNWGTLQDYAGPDILIPQGQLGAGKARGVFRINDSLRELGYTGWLEFELGSINMALFDTGKVGEKTNIPGFKFTEKRIVTPRVSVDTAFEAVTGEKSTFPGSTGKPEDSLPNPNHVRRTIAGETNSHSPNRAHWNPTPIRLLDVNQEVNDYSTGWHRTGSVSAYDAIAQELTFRKGEKFEWQRGRLNYDEVYILNSYEDVEFRTFVADPLVADMRSLSESPAIQQKLETPNTNPEIDSKVGSAVDPTDAGTPGQPQPPPGTAAAIDEVASKNLAEPNGSLPSSGAKEISNNPAGDEKLKVPSSEETPKISDTSRLISSEEGKIPRPETASAAKINTEEERVNAQEQSRKATNAAADAENQAGAKVSGAESEAKASSGEKASSAEKGSAKADAGPAGPKAEEVVEELTEKQKEKYKNQILKAQAIINDPGVPEGEKNAAKNLVDKLNKKLGPSAGNPSTATSGGGPSKPSTAGGGPGGGGRPPNRPSGGINTPGNASSPGAGSGGGGSPGGGGAGGPGGPGGNGRPPGRPPSGASPGGGSPGGGAGGGGGPSGPHWNRGASGAGHGAHAAAGGAGGAKAAAAAAAGQPLNIRGGIKNAYGNIRSAFSSFFSSGGGARGPRGGFGTVAGAAATASRPGTRTSSIIKAWAFNSSFLERELDLTTRGFVAGLGSIVNDLGLNRRETAYGVDGKASAYMDTFFGTTIRGGKGFAHPSMEVTSSGTRTGRVVWSTKATAQEALEGWSTHIDDAVTNSSGVMRGMNRMRQFTFNLLGGKTSTINRTIARLGGVGTLIAPTFLGITAVSDFRQGYRHGGIPGGLVGAAKGIATGWIVNKMMATALLNPVAAVITGTALAATAYTAYKIFDVRNKGSNYLKMGRMQGMSWNKGPTAGMNSLMANTIKHRSIMGMENSRLNAMRSMGNEGYMMSAPKSRYANSTAIHSNSSLLSLANS